MSHYPIHPEISLAQTLPGAAYVDIDFFMLQRERIFARSWQYLPVVPDNKHNVYPITLLPGLLDVPLLMTQAAEGDWQLLSNVCTHRGAVLVDAATQCRTVRCPYHGRSFGLDGRMLAMPAFEATRDFPAATDHLPRLSLAWSGLLPFVNLDVSLDAKASFAPLGQILDELFAWVPWQDFRFAPELSRDYALAANWMLYVDNYLEGLHIPYVHPALNRALDFKAYVTKPLELGVLQIGLAADGEVCFDLPEAHPDYGTQVAAYYLWLFPNLMLNLYPWGLSLNLIEPQALDRTRVRYLSWVWKPELLHTGAGADTDSTEQEDHGVILRVQQGVRSRLYTQGRYSATMEQGVHRFHQLLSQWTS